MAVTKILTPNTVGSADYPIVQVPHLGGQKQAKLSTKPVRVLGTGFLSADGVIDYKFLNLPIESAGAPTSPILAVSLTGIFGAAAVTVNYGGISAAFQPVGWSSKQTGQDAFTFGAGRAVELIGNYVSPVASSVPTAAAALQGSKFALIQVPNLTDFTTVGCTNQSRVQIPVKQSKSIPCGMNEAEWVTPGTQKPGDLEITGLSHGPDDGLQKFAGLNCTVLLETIQQDRVIAMREICSNWVCAIEENNPSGEGESTLTAKSMFEKIMVLPAP